MWSLPDIQQLNKEAEERYQADIASPAKTVEDIFRAKFCAYCDEDAKAFYDWFDVFSDKPKGRLFLCAEHDKHYEGPADGFFHCDYCERIFISNYTWENYFTYHEGMKVCLNCALEVEVSNQDNWISNSSLIDFDYVTSRKHLIPVGGSFWKSLDLEFLGNVELDSMTGEALYSTREAGVQELQELADKGIKKYGEVFLILDAAYQFAISIGVYAKKA